MYKLNINGKDYEFQEERRLIEVLREDLGLTSVKNGCGEGACGTCTVLIDGKAMRACVQRISRLDGKKIITAEGLSDREKDVYGYAFAKAGSVQCGYCIPGIVMSAKGLIDTNPNPTREEVKQAIRFNICRCTGYQKIEDGILLAAEYLRENKEVPDYKMLSGVGQEVFRVDAVPKTLGIAKYADDYSFPGMLHARNVFTAHARAKILSIDTGEAEKMPGVVRILLADDIPGERYIGHLAFDWPGMIAVGEETKFIGDTLALVVAETREQADAAVKAVKVEYEVLKPVNNFDEAMEDGAPQVHGEGFWHFGKFRVPENNLFDHEEVVRGDAAGEMEKCAHVVEGTFTMPATEHAFMETETAVGMPDGDGVHVITGSQGIYDEKRELARYLGLPEDKVRITSAFVGGGFGGKEDMSVQHQAALCAYILKKPVKVSFTRQESINYHPKRHAMRIWMKLGCDKDGIIKAMQAHLIADTGAYASLGGPVLQRACTHAGGPYNYENVEIKGDAYYTNNPPAGAFRGFGVTQSIFVIESLLNQLAEKVGLDGWEIRWRNRAQPGGYLPNGQLCDPNVGFPETLMAVKDDFYRYENDPDYFVGIASSLKNAGVGVGLVDPGRCDIELHNDGKIHCYSSAAAIGQGVATVILQMVGETTGWPYDKIIVEAPDTANSPNAGTTTASRQTVFTGQAARLAAEQFKAELDKGVKPEELIGKRFCGEYDYETDPINSTKPHPVSHISYGFATQLYILNKEGLVEKVIAAHDAGKVINPLSASGQVDGGVAMGLGYGLSERFDLKDGVPQQKLGTLGLFRAPAMPPVETRFVHHVPDEDVAFGAKGIGEITCTMGAPALQNAYYKFDGVYRYDLPLENTPYNKPKKKK